MSFTYSSLKTAIQDYTQNTETTFTTHLDTFIKNAEERILKNIQLSGCKFYAVNNFPDIKKNIDVKGYGHQRLLNIEIDPFNLLFLNWFLLVVWAHLKPEN